jgi:hypothetical protein
MKGEEGAGKEREGNQSKVRPKRNATIAIPFTFSIAPSPLV